MATYQYFEYSFSHTATPQSARGLIYADSEEMADAKASQYFEIALNLGDFRFTGRILPCTEIYARSFFEALLLSKELYGKFVYNFGFDYIFGESDYQGGGFSFEDNDISFRSEDLFDPYSDGDNWTFFDEFDKHSLEAQLVALLKSVGFRVTHEGRDEGDALFIMSRDEPLPVNLPDWTYLFSF